MSSMNAWQFLRDLHTVCHFTTIEGDKTRTASTSELKRWLQNGVVQCNGERLAWDEPMDFPIISFVLFPNNPQRRCTLY